MLVVVQNQAQDGSDLLESLLYSIRLLLDEIFSDLGLLQLLLVIEHTAFARQDCV